MALKSDGSMSMSSITDAPSWRELPAATPRERGLDRRASARLELVSADAARLLVMGRREWRAPVLLSPPLLALGSLAWLAPLPVDAARAVTSAACVAAAAGIVAWAWPRRQRLEIAARGSSAPGSLVVQPGNVHWRLDAEHVPDTPRTTYRVSLVGDGSVHTVLQNADPERLLWQFSEVLRHWPGPVDHRWGLPEAARPWSIEPHSGPRSERPEGTQRVVTAPWAHRPLKWCTQLMAAFVVVDLGFLLTSGGRGLDSIHPLSSILAAALACCLVALAAALSNGSNSLCIDGRVYGQTALFGVRRRRGGVRTESVRGVYALGAAGAEVWHVLVDSADGPLALEVPRQQAAALTREAEAAIAAARVG